MALTIWFSSQNFCFPKLPYFLDTHACTLDIEEETGGTGKGMIMSLDKKQVVSHVRRFGFINWFDAY